MSWKEEENEELTDAELEIATGGNRRPSPDFPIDPLGPPDPRPPGFPRKEVTDETPTDAGDFTVGS